MNRQDGARPGGDRTLNQIGIHVVGSRVWIHGNRLRTHPTDSQPSGNEGVGRNDHFIARTYTHPRSIK